MSTGSPLPSGGAPIRRSSWQRPTASQALPPFGVSQISFVPGHLQTAPEHVDPPLQIAPQSPQFFESVEVSTQAPPHVVFAQPASPPPPSTSPLDPLLPLDPLEPLELDRPSSPSPFGPHAAITPTAIAPTQTRRTIRSGYHFTSIAPRIDGVAIEPNV